MQHLILDQVPLTSYFSFITNVNYDPLYNNIFHYKNKYYYNNKFDVKYKWDTKNVETLDMKSKIRKEALDLKLPLLV